MLVKFQIWNGAAYSAAHKLMVIGHWQLLNYSFLLSKCNIIHLISMIIVTRSKLQLSCLQVNIIFLKDMCMLY